MAYKKPNKNKEMPEAFKILWSNLVVDETYRCSEYYWPVWTREEKNGEKYIWCNKDTKEWHISQLGNDGLVRVEAVDRNPKKAVTKFLAEKLMRGV